MGKVKKIIRDIAYYVRGYKVEYRRNSYSQAGEDLIIKFLFNGRKIFTPSYLDIGTSHPSNDNNTYLFYSKGAKGVCVEANETLIGKIKEARPRDTVLNIGVNVGEDETATFYMFDDPALNTFSKEEAEFREKTGSFKIIAKQDVRLKAINDIIKENYSSYPDFLSLDIEGVDLEVLKSLNFNKYPIPVVCVETCTYSENHIKPKNGSITDFMLANNYFIYGDTYINTIYVNREWFFNLSLVV